MNSKEIIFNLKLSLIVSITMLMFGCNKSTNDSSDKIKSEFALTEYKNTKSILTGKILDESTITKYELNNRYGPKKILIDSNRFKTTLDHDFPMIVDLRIRGGIIYPIFISPGDSIHLEYNEIDLRNNFTRISFSGNHSKENDLLIKLKGILKYDNTNNINFYNCSEEIFLQKIDSIQKIANRILQGYKKEKPTEFNDFERLAQSYIDYRIANYIEAYPDIVEWRLWKESIVLSEKYSLKRKSYPINDSNHLNNTSFANYILKIVSRNTSEIFEGEGYDKKGRMFPDLTCYANSIESIFENKEIIDFLKYRMLSYEIHVTQDKPKLFYEEYKASKPHSTYLSKLEEQIKETIKIKKDYVFKDGDGTDRYLSEFKNKIVYIDIWATWCAPCMLETKHFEELINRFTDKKKDIVFLGISLDTDIVKWKRMLVLKELKGAQFISPLGFKSALCKDYDIGEIPRFMIINRDGVIIEPNAIRPSMEGIYEHLNKMIDNPLLVGNE